MEAQAAGTASADSLADLKCYYPQQDVKLLTDTFMVNQNTDYDDENEDGELYTVEDELEEDTL